MDATNLFDFIKIMFTNKDEYKKLKPHQKARHYFMVNRFMSIQYPIQANYLQHVKINPSAVVDFWHDTMSSMYTRVPNWMYVKTKKEKKEKELDKFNVDESVIKEYCKKMGYSRKQVDEAIKFFPNEMKEELKKFERLINK